MELHSMVDCITNSSSVVYSWPHSSALERTKTFIQKLLSAINPELKCEDYFEFHYDFDRGPYPNYFIKHSNHFKLFCQENNIEVDNFDKLENKEELYEKLVSEALENYETGGISFFTEYEEDSYEEAPYAENLLVKVNPINNPDQEMDFMQEFTNIFGLEGGYNG